MTTEVRTRRLRMTSPQSEVVRIPEVSVQRLLVRLSEIHEEQKVLAQVDSDVRAQLFKLMQDSSRNAAATNDVIAEIERSKGRAVNTIDAQKYFSLVSQKDFFATVKVGITEAKKVLTEKELAPITTTIPAVLGEPQLSLTFLSDKKK